MKIIWPFARNSQIVFHAFLQASAHVRFNPKQFDYYLLYEVAITDCFPEGK